MNRKGFTLIELLAIILLMSVFLIVVFPNILDGFQKKEIEIDNATLEILYSSTAEYMEKYNDIYSGETGVTYCIPISDIDDEGLVPVDVSKYRNHMVKVKIGKNSNSNSYQVTDCESPTSVTLDKHDEEVELFGTLQLTATVTPEDSPEKRVRWKSSNERIATVDNKGFVTTKHGGIATITASTSNGVSDSANITVYQTVNVTFNAKGGSVSPTQKTVRTYQAYGTLPTSTYGSYTFGGWYTDDNEKMEAADLVTILTDHTLNAKWLTTGSISKGKDHRYPLTEWAGVKLSASSSSGTCYWYSDDYHYERYSSTIPASANASVYLCKTGGVSCTNKKSVGSGTSNYIFTKADYKNYDEFYVTTSTSTGGCSGLDSYSDPASASASASGYKEVK